MKIKNLINLAVFSAMMMSPLVLSAKSHHHCSSDHHHNNNNNAIKTIRNQDVAGYYQISGFTNSTDPTVNPLEIQSQALVGQVRILKNGTGSIRFIDLITIVNNQAVNTHLENVPLTYTLGPINGYGVVSLPNFPTPGVNRELTVSFKMHEGKVTGFSQLVTDINVPTSKWSLIQGERFN